ncbi:diguanylate cyclase domain-containing protein [Roseofilum casamattae]|uniref:Diguanylate cyclase n=1 Tax=Roseofilum casamattae BLCC-M143 TaxID=3022442 RepID=A0ABT7C2G5_9CYAN|nr:diguanylate cyclase [Roseofilum casamattae]MDJ1185639.1 diguanylate cyclase [Roseofilum casamattae BLCC-M143]
MTSAQRSLLKDIAEGIGQLRSRLLQLRIQLSRLLYQHVIIILVSLLSLGFGIAVVGTYYLSVSLVNSQAMHYSMVAVQTLNEARKLYSKNAVNRVKFVHGVLVTPEYHNITGAIPNPATYTIELGQLLSNESEGILFRLYSDYPFPNRTETGGPQDSFQREALKYLNENPQDAFYRREEFGDRLSFRYTEAVLMEPSCVACHNTLPNSPKKDWKVGEVRGVVEITQPLDRIMLMAEDGLKMIYIALAAIIALAITGLILVVGRFRIIHHELEEKVSERTAALHHLATVDDLTQLFNRREFDRRLEIHWQRAQYNQDWLSLILCDVDYFKKYNDTYGHQAGDDCLHAVARVLKTSAQRSGEFAARCGGEEFAIVLPNINGTQACRVAHLIRERIHQLHIPHRGSLTHAHVTLSLGIASIIPEEDSSLETLIKAADRALYQAKAEGRDRFIVYHGNLVTPTIDT